MVKEVLDKDFNEVVLNSKMPVLVDFWAPWCGPCRMVGPVVEKLSDFYGDRVSFCKVNVDEAPQSSRNYGIASIPTIMFFKDGQKVNQIIGAVPESTIKPMIEALL
jgi:thioredoxin 1